MDGIRDEAEYTGVCEQIRVQGCRHFLALSGIAKAQSTLTELESIQLSGVQDVTEIPHDLSKPKSLVQYLRLVLTGFAMGAADIVPGVSGGTMAFILGVYSNLIDAIKSFNMDAIRMLFELRFKDLIDHVSLRFLLALGAGLFSAILLLSSFLSAAMDDPGGRILLFAFFFGLVLASILTIGVKVRWSVASVLDVPYGHGNRIRYRQHRANGGRSFGARLVRQRYDRHYRDDSAGNIRFVHAADSGSI